MKNLLNLVKILFGWPLSIAAIFFLVRIIITRFNSIHISIYTINWFLLSAGALCFLIYFLLRGYLWYKILQKENHSIPLYEVFYLWEISELKRFIPGNVWSFLGRTVLFSQKGIEKKTIFFSMLSEAQYLVLGSLIVSLFSLRLLLVTSFWNLAYKNLLTNITFVVVILITLLLVFHSLLHKNHTVKKIFTTVLPPFSISKSLLLVFIAALGMFFYGFGIYLTIVSVLYINPTLILGFIGLFSLAFLIGYLSFITPMGLGVREAIMISTLVYIMPISAASLAAIFSRIILIISEMIIFILLYVWQKTRFNYMFKHAHEITLWLSIIVYDLYFSSVSILRYQKFFAGKFDLGNMDQVVWNTLQGNVFQFTNPNGITNMSRLGFHADFILILLAPFYLIWSDPRMLLLMQTIILSLGALFVFLIAKNVLKNKNIALALSISYLLNPGVELSNLYDFHGVVLATTFLLGAFYFLQKKSYGPFILFLTLGAITKEQVWVVAAIFGLYVFWTYKKRLLGFIIFFTSLMFFYYLIWKGIPTARGGEHFALTYYSEFGDSPTRVIANLIFSPMKTISTLANAERITYLYQVISPLGFLSLLSPLYLIFATGDFAINLLSNNAQLHQIYYQYTAVITPFIFISSIFGIKFLLNRFPQVPAHMFTAYIILWALLSAYFFGPLPGAQNPNLDMITVKKDHSEEVNIFLKNIPHDKKVAATNNIGAHVTQRKYVYTIPLGLNDADVILFKIDDPYSQPPPLVLKKLINQLLANKNYKLIYKVGDFYAFELAK